MGYHYSYLCHIKMRNYIYITLLSLISAIALATGLFSNPRHMLQLNARFSSTTSQNYVDTFQEENSDRDQNFILTSNRNSISAQRSTAQRHTSRRNSISKTYNSAALKSGKNFDCRTVSAYRKTELLPLAAKSGGMLIIRLHEFLI